MTRTRLHACVVGALLIGLAVVGVARYRRCDDRAPRASRPSEPRTPSAAASATDETGGPSAIEPSVVPEVAEAHVEGTVRDLMTGSGVAAVSVLFRAPGAEVTAESGGGGAYAVGLAPGRYQVRAVGTEVVSYRSLWLEVAPGASTKGLDILVSRMARIDGVVVDERGEPLAGAAIRHRTELVYRTLTSDETAPMGAATTAEDGQFSIRVPPGRVELLANVADYPQASTTVRWVAPGAHLRGVEIVMDRQAETAGAPVDAGADARGGEPEDRARGSLAGVVSGEAGAPNPFSVGIAGHRSPAGEDSGPDVEQPSWFAATDGAYRIDELDPGVYRLVFAAPGYAPLEVDGAVVRAGATTTVDATLERGGSVTGTVRHAETRAPIAGAVVLLSTGHEGAHAVTDADGKFTIDDVAPGRRSVEVRHPLYVNRLETGLVIAAVQTRQVDVLLEPLAPGSGPATEFAGIGAVLRMIDGHFMVEDVLPHGPAKVAGLLAGDEIVSIDDASVGGRSFGDLIEAIRGVAGTAVTLGIRRQDEPVFYRAVVRGTIRFDPEKAPRR